MPGAQNFLIHHWEIEGQKHNTSLLIVENDNNNNFYWSLKRIEECNDKIDGPLQRKNLSATVFMKKNKGLV